MVENTSTIKQLIREIKNIPFLKDSSILRDVIDIKEKFNFGTVVIVDKKNTVLGIITDGDLRRIITKSQKHYSALMVESVINFMNKNPIYINHNNLSIDTIKEIFVSNKILDIVVVDNDKCLKGIIHIHDILEKYV
tara:strand:+ start:178 stop:585 length:408 start_codon:yes stop_codon:yes gene_type:complete